MNKKKVFVTGGTGFMGRRLIETLVKRGHSVDALVRQASIEKLPDGCRAVVGDALDGSSYAAALSPEHVFVQLVGVTHPGPLKKDLFQSIDYQAGHEAVKTAAAARVRHFVYLSVAQPAPIMQSYATIRARVETLIRESGLSASILRPWYVLGPGRRWPLLFTPLYRVLERFPSTREAALRLALVNHEQMTAALLNAVENDTGRIRIYEVPDIKKF